MNKLIRFAEPSLVFKYGQSLEDPRDGLSMFGPLDQGKPHGIRAGFIGTKSGLDKFKRWIGKIQSVISNSPPRRKRPPFPGFSAAFGIPWEPRPLVEIIVDERALHDTVRLDDKHLRVYRTVDLYSSRIVEALRGEVDKPDIWFVIVPDDVYRYCRPKSYVETEERISTVGGMDARDARRAITSPFLFSAYNENAKPYQFDLDFHNQLKARLLESQSLTQIIRESTIAHMDFLKPNGTPIRDLDILQSEIAWNISSAVFYKAGGRPWKLGGVRDGVCYIGLVFKRVEKDADPCSACCAAQMFLDSGDGVVFKGDIGPWYTPRRGDFHLKEDAAKSLVKIAVEAYKSKNDGKPPCELFIHGKTWFNDEEWKGFSSAVDQNTTLVGVRIVSGDDLRLFSRQEQPILRGLAYIKTNRSAYLWTKGFVPRLQTYPGMEVPRPLEIDVCRGHVEIETVLRDILGLTKLNYNSCRFADGIPVTLRFADAIGEILTCGPIKGVPPLRFSHYI